MTAVSEAETTLGAPDKKPENFPAWLSCDILLADGEMAAVRPILPSDGPLLDQFHRDLSQESQFLRFFGFHPQLSPDEVRRFVTVDYFDRLALLAFVAGRLVAVARYDRAAGNDEAEVAFTVTDDQQGLGLGTILLEHLAAAAAAHGIRTFAADVLPQNRRMLDVFHSVGFTETASLEGGVVRVVLSLETSAEYTARVSERERLSTTRSIAHLLRPTSIAVIGASARPRTIGNALVENLLAGHFKGPIYPVNPRTSTIAGLNTYPSVTAISGPVDLALVVVPEDKVLAVVEECGEKKVNGLVVISAGFAETGEPGRAAQQDLLRLARRHGMRMIGPNCMGVVNTDPAVSMDATFAPISPVAGPIAFSSQSGGLGIAILNEATRRGLGISTFVSVGNKADVSGNDLLQYWEEDEASRVILLYLESFGNPRRFARIARRVSRKKPIVAVKSGRSPGGSRGASSHTAAIATPDAEVDALFRQAGVIRVDTLEELFDVADVLSHQPLPQGNRVAIVCNAGGPGVLAADACESHGLIVPELSQDTQSVLKGFLSSQAAVSNPVDCIASASADDYRRAVEAVLADANIDCVIVIFTPPLVTEATDVAQAVASVAATSEKPIVATFLATNETLAALQEGERRVPWFAYPESAARAFGKIAPYARWRARGEPPLPELPGIDGAGARSLVTGAVRTGGARWLNPSEVTRLLECYGIRTIPTVTADSPEEAVADASALGFPVALKVVAEGVVHKSDAGGVCLGLATTSEVEVAAADLLARFGKGASLVVQPMAPVGVELIAGLYEDADFGPVVMFGLGGTLTELLGDHVLSLTPLSHDEALDMIDSIRAAPLLKGYRGRPAVARDLLADLLCRIGRLADDLPEIAEVDLNPLVATPDGYLVLDARVRVSPPASAGDNGWERRRLR